MKTAEEIASRLATIKKSLQATDLHSLTLRFEEVEKLIEEYRSQPTESKELPGDDRMVIEILNKIVIHSKKCRDTEVGHGVVVALANECLILLNDKHDLLASRDARTESKELPGDDKVNNQSKVSCKGNSHAMRYHHMLEQFRDGAKWMRSIASPLLASKDARIRELEEALRSIEIGADPLSEYQAHSWIDTAREIANKALTPPKN